MAETLTEAELDELNEALEDGFPDMLGRRSAGNKRSYGKLFGTNPLGEETVYFMPTEGAPYELGKETLSDTFEVEDGIFAKVDDFRQYFALNPIGCNFDNLQRYFEARMDEKEAFLEQRFQKYLETAEPYPRELLVYEPGYPDVFDGVYNYPQWLENVLVPYSKLWFESNICNLFNSVSGFIASGRTSQYGNHRQIETIFLIGRMIEQYRWKFTHEAMIVSRKRQSELAGYGGGGDSSSKRLLRLEKLMSEVERLADLATQISEERIVAQAWENAEAEGFPMPKTPKIRAQYDAELRSYEPFKSRYESVFKRNA